MSKGRSGLFPSSNANAKMLRGMTYRAIHTMVDNTKALSTKNTVDVCTEFHVVNDLLLNGSNISDNKLTHSIRPRTGKGRPYCINCKKMFSDLIK